MTPTPSILFVCLGNICRSPLAEGALRAEAGRRGLAVQVDSAGTGGLACGEPPDERAIAVAVRHGVDITGLRARQVTREDFTRFDHIVALDHDNLSHLRRLAPADTTARFSLLLDHVPGREGQAVTDPWFGEAEGFDITWAEVTAAARGLVDEALAPLPPRPGEGAREASGREGRGETEL